ncbi:MAG TPA: D-amino acid dehydrogenase [Caulobacteraceae bacterium]|nr:D-amino acid dehydrogenase [Caulobacteraceae bacterium]
MRVVVLGAGVIGVTTAYFLARAGHEVTVVERRDGPALETSFANAGEISPGAASPWMSPEVPRKALRWLFMEHAPLILRPRAEGAMLRWLLAAAGNCTARAYAINKGRMVRLAEYSRHQLDALRAETGIAYDERARGSLQLFRTQDQLDDAGRDVEVLRRDGVAFELLDRAGCVAAEPGLQHSSESFVGGLRLPDDETGDCHKFTTSLATLASGLGVRFRYDERVLALVRSGGGVEAVNTDRGLLRAEAFVVACGSFSPALVGPVGLRLPVYPVKGYSLTADIVAAERAPVSTVIDETYKVATTRLGDRVRVGGIAEVSGYNDTLPPRRRAALLASTRGLFPGAGDWEHSRFWTGLRPMTPDGAPVVGATPIPNLWLNTGHGTLGWTMACGSARVLGDIISGREPEIETADLSISRYRGGARAASRRRRA